MMNRIVKMKEITQTGYKSDLKLKPIVPFKRIYYTTFKQKYLLSIRETLSIK